MSKAKRISGQKVQKPEKMGFLYLFLVPLFISVVKSLFSSDYSGFMLGGLGFLMLLGSVTMAKRGFDYSIAYEKAKLAKAPKTPLKTLAAVGLGVTSFYLSFFVGGKEILPSLFVGILAPVGFWLYYGLDPKKDKLGSIKGVSAELVLETIHEANRKLTDIRSDMGKIHDTQLHEKLTIATQKADTILDVIQEDPKDIRVARKFLIVYIDGIAKVTDAYTQLDEEDIAAETREKLSVLLDDVEERFNIELQRLKANNHFDLDVQIDVLKEQIKH
jgi:hypothetical protein